MQTDGRTDGRTDRQTQTDRQTDTNLTVAFGNFADAPKTEVVVNVSDFCRSVIFRIVV
jgi:hypothetical protein